MRLLIISTFCVILSACSAQTITDPITKPEVEVIENITLDMMVVEYQWDAMSRGNLEYWGKVVVDPKFYENNQIRRGDVVYFLRPPIDHNKYPNIQVSFEHDILRVIALSGEKIKVKDAQIYINDKKLDTFYGSFHHGGLNYEQFYQGDVSGIGSYSYDEILIPEGHVFLMGDDWWRSIDSHIFGPVPVENIVGKVLGYETKPIR